MSLTQVQAEPGEQVEIPLSLSGTASPGIISLRIRISYPGDWLTFVSVRQTELVKGGGFLVLSNVISGEDQDLLAISVAGTNPLGGEGKLFDLVFRLNAAARNGQQAMLLFTAETRANRGEPVLLTEPGLVEVHYRLPLGDFNNDRIVNYDDFFFFADHFGSRRGERLFEEVCDLNENGLLDLDDFFRFADRFGVQY